MKNTRKILACFGVSILSSCAFNNQTIESTSEEDVTPHYLKDAKWIWLQEKKNNEWVDFIKEFELNELPSKAIAEIGVENKYYLWVNETPVIYDGGLKRGPNKKDGYFDQIDLSPYLKEGKNKIAIKAWFWGIKGTIGKISYESYSNVRIGEAGLIFALNLGDRSILSDDSWFLSKDEAFKDDSSEAYSIKQPNYRFPEYNIYYDANYLEHENWKDSDFDASLWQKAKIIANYGDAPFNNLEKRPIPLLKEYGLKDYENSTTFANFTADEDVDLTLNIPYNTQFTPYLKVKTNSVSKISIKTEDTDLTESVQTTYITSPNGEQEFESPAWISGEKVTYSISKGTTVLSLKYRESGYDTKLTGSFTMNDEFYDNLWQMGSRTQAVCMRENFMDCPDRERAQWTGDATSQMRQMMYCMDTNSYSLYQKMISQKINFIEEDENNELYNLLPTVSPIDGEFYEIPAQEMAGIIGLLDYYKYTADASVLFKAYEPALNYMKLWKFGKNGLIRHKTGQGLPDWQDTAGKVDTKVCDNAWYYWCLSSLKEIAQIIGRKDTSWIDEKMNSIKNEYANFWQEGIGYVDETLDDRGNALAVLSGLATNDQYPTIIKVLESTLNSSSYMESYVLMAMCEMGYIKEALARIKTRYSYMVESNLINGRTTLWEYFDEKGTYNHAWTASPVYILSKYVAGIKPSSVGYETYEINPSLENSSDIKAVVSCIKGEISIEASKSADRYTIKIQAPQKAKGTVSVPLLNGRIQLNGSLIYENGKSISFNGAKLIKITDKNCYFEISQEGTYEFVSF